MWHNTKNKRKSAFGKEVEIYNGTEWKSISKYRKGEKILCFFWEDNENRVELLEPLAYIKHRNNDMVRIKIQKMDFSLNRDAIFIGDYDGNSPDSKQKSICTTQQAIDGNFAIFAHCRAYSSFTYNSTTTSMLSADQLRVMTLSIMYGEITNGMYCTLKTKSKTLKKHLQKCLKGGKIKSKVVMEGEEAIFSYILPRAKELFCTSPLMLSNSEIYIVIDELNRGFEKNKIRCEDVQIQTFIQMVYARSGRRVQIYNNDIKRSNNGFTLLERRCKYCRSRETMEYSFTTRGGYFMIRVNGTILAVGDYAK